MVAGIRDPRRDRFVDGALSSGTGWRLARRAPRAREPRVGLLVGLILGALVSGVSIVAIVIVGGVAIAGYALLLAPAFGIAVGTLSSRIDRLAMRANQRVLLRTGRVLATMTWLVAFLGVPIAIGLAIAIVGRRLGLP